jgi:hypothetical protein
MVPLYRGATTTTTRPPLPVDRREQGILCKYLFA